MEITLKRSQANVKKPKHLQNVFLIYSPRTIKIEPSRFQKIDTEIILLLPKNSKGFVTSIFRGDEIIEFNGDQQRLWVEILNKSYKETIEIKKNIPLGFVVIEPEHLKFKHEAEKTESKKKALLPKTTTYKPKTSVNMAVFLAVMTLLMLAKTLLI